jgi:hypothetical protein
MANASGGPDNITVIIVSVCDEEAIEDVAVTEEEAMAQFPPLPTDTQPLPMARLKPTTLPEGKFYTDKNQTND